MVEIFHFLQNSPEWWDARLGIPTASKFATVMAKTPAGKGRGKTSTEYMLKLAGETITGQPMDSYSNHHMDRGKEMEGEARDLYAFMRGAEPEPVGFLRSGQKGASPDSLVGPSGLLEIKTALPHILINRLLSEPRLPPEHRAQVQGQLWVAERDWCDFVTYWPGLPLFTVREYRDEDYIARLASEVDRFNDELASIVEQLRRMGGFSEAAE